MGIYVKSKEKLKNLCKFVDKAKQTNNNFCLIYF